MLSLSVQRCRKVERGAFAASSTKFDPDLRGGGERVGLYKVLCKVIVNLNGKRKKEAENDNNEPAGLE